MTTPCRLRRSKTSTGAPFRGRDKLSSMAPGRPSGLGFLGVSALEWATGQFTKCPPAPPIPGCMRASASVEEIAVVLRHCEKRRKMNAGHSCMHFSTANWFHGTCSTDLEKLEMIYSSILKWSVCRCFMTYVFFMFNGYSHSNGWFFVYHNGRKRGCVRGVISVPPVTP